MHYDHWSAMVPTCGGEHPGVELAVSLREALHHSVNLLGLTGQTEAPEELPVVMTTTQHQHQQCSIVCTYNLVFASTVFLRVEYFFDLSTFSIQ